MEHWVRLRLQDHGHGSLRYPVGYSRRSEDPCANTRFRDRDGLHRPWEITSRRRPIPKLEQIVLKIPFKLCQRLSVGPCRTLVAARIAARLTRPVGHHDQ